MKVSTHVIKKFYDRLLCFISKRTSTSTIFREQSRSKRTKLPKRNTTLKGNDNKPHPQDEQEQSDIENDCELIIGKNRHGSTITIPMSFEGKYTRYKEIL